MNLEISEPALRLTRRSFLVSSASAAALLALPFSRLGSLALAAQTPAAGSGVFLDPTILHEVVATFDQDEYDAMIAAYQADETKDWIKASMTIDGQAFDEVGMRLKGNSSLMALRQNGGNFGGGGNGNANGTTTTTGQLPTFTNMDGTPVAANLPTTDQAQAAQDNTQGFQMGAGGSSISAEEPEGLPWLVRLDKYVDDQNYGGLSEFVIRSNNSKTALNEALALGLLAEAGLASQNAAFIRFTANEQGPRLRLAIENPDDTWMEDHFSDSGILYKSEADGNWSWKDDDLDAYMSAFDLEAGGGDDDADNYAPLISFLDFVNNSDDATFASDLPDRLDVENFATYMAMMDLISNSDDIDGPGNNSYLFYDETSSMMTVVPWDMNLAFGGMGGMGGAGRTFQGGQMPGGDFTIDGTPVAGQFPAMTNADGTPVAGGQGMGQGGAPNFQQGGNGGGPGGGGFGGMSNPLVERWNEVDAFTTLQAEAKTQLSTDLFQSGIATGILSRWVDVLETQATDLVDQSTIDSESQSLQEQIDAA